MGITNKCEISKIIHFTLWDGDFIIACHIKSGHLEIVKKEDTVIGTYTYICMCVCVCVCVCVDVWLGLGPMAPIRPQSPDTLTIRPQTHPYVCKYYVCDWMN